MSAFKWQDPPAAAMRKGAGKHAAIAAELRANPGRWALVLEGNSNSHAINKGLIACYLPAGSFESVARRRADGKSDTYARYIGGENA